MKTISRKNIHWQIATIIIILVLLVTLFVSPASAHSLGPNLPGAGVNLTGIGTVAWSDPGYITIVGSDATASVTSGGGITNYLLGTQFGFAIPSGSMINGITVEIYRRTVGNPNPELRDYEVKLVKGGTIVGDNKADTTTDWPHGGYAMVTYGGPADKWGETWSVDDINSSEFGVVLAVINQNATNDKSARVDYMQITVEYTPADNPDLTLFKTATPTTYDTVGDVIGYSFLLTNNGNVTLDGPFTVTDDQAEDESCPATDSLAPAASITCTASYTISQADLDAGSVTNTGQGQAFFDATPVDSNQDSETVTANQNPALSLVKTATPTTYDTVGDVIGYSFELSNSGNVTLSGPFTVTDDKATDESCPVTASLAPGASITCDASYTITQADLDAGSVTNTAQGHGTFDVAPVDSNQDSETVTASQGQALTLVKTATPQTYDSVGDVIGYSFLLTNSGSVTLSGLFTVTDDKTTDESCPATVSLAPGASITCTASYTTTQADLDTGSVTNTAQGHGYDDATPVNSNQDSETVNATQESGLTLVKTPTPNTFFIMGDVIDYSYELTNSGNVTLDGPFTVVDDMVTVTCPGTTSLAPGASISCTASYTIVIDDIIAGSVRNTATGAGFFGGNMVTSAPDEVTVNRVSVLIFLPVVTRDNTE